MGEYKHKYNKAIRHGFSSFSDRFKHDHQFREDMLALGWDDAKAESVDQIAALANKPNFGRTRAERAKHEGFYIKYQSQFSGNACKEGGANAERYVANARRVRETAYYQKPGNGKGKSNAKGKLMDRVYDGKGSFQRSENSAESGQNDRDNV